MLYFLLLFFYCSSAQELSNVLLQLLSCLRIILKDSFFVDRGQFDLTTIELTQCFEVVFKCSLSHFFSPYLFSRMTGSPYLSWFMSFFVKHLQNTGWQKWFSSVLQNVTYIAIKHSIIEKLVLQGTEKVNLSLADYRQILQNKYLLKRLNFTSEIFIEFWWSQYNDLVKQKFHFHI